MMQLGRIGASALALPALIGWEARASRQQASLAAREATARSCILVYLWGGPPQQDLWDLKPHAAPSIRSLFQPIPTVVPGIEVCDQMPRFAQCADRLAIVRSLTHASNVHEPSVYHTLTGHADPTMVIPRNARSRLNHPNLGAVISALLPGRDLPAAVTIPRPIGHDGITYAGTHAGYLGPQFDPLELQAAPMSKEQAAHPVMLPAEVASARLEARRGLLQQIEEQDRRFMTGKEARSLDTYRAQAFSMIASEKARKAFRVDDEPPALRERYGLNEYGESFLLARRLVEAGVRLVTITWMYFLPSGRVSNVWDNHGGGSVSDFGTSNGTEMLKQKYCIPPLDLAYSALVNDLADRGLLDETLVAMFGEFGRTPKLNSAGGRDHWGPCQSAVLAGGGIRGGQVYGSSDADAAYPKTNPVSPRDLLATIYHAMGLPPEAEIHDRQNRPHRISDGTPIAALF
jgi:hypothetical protein